MGCRGESGGSDGFGSVDLCGVSGVHQSEGALSSQVETVVFFRIIYSISLL